MGSGEVEVNRHSLAVELMKIGDNDGVMLSTRVSGSRDDMHGGLNVPVA